MFRAAQPRHRYLRIFNQLRKTGKCSPEDPLEEALARLLQGDSSVPEEVTRSFSIFADTYKREVVEAFLLAEASAADLQLIFKIKEEISKAYAHLFFDTSVFYDLLDSESYARNYNEDDFGREIKICAIEDGLEYLKTRFGRGRYNVAPVTALRELLSLAYVNTKVASKVPLDSDKAKEARQWASVMSKGVESLHKAEEFSGGRSSEYVLRLELLHQKSEEKLSEASEEISPEDIVNKRTEGPL